MNRKAKHMKAAEAMKPKGGGGDSPIQVPRERVKDGNALSKRALHIS